MNTLTSRFLLITLADLILYVIFFDLMCFGRLMLSGQIGDLISGHCSCKVPCKCGCQALAQNVYSKLHRHHQAIVCMLKQGRVHAGIDYAKNK